jgi:DHA2 family multidrug resistance protein
MAFRQEEFGLDALATAAAVPPTAGGVSLRSWVGFIAMGFGMVLAILDVQIVASSLPDLQVGLRLQLDQLSWIQTA